MVSAAKTIGDGCWVSQSEEDISEELYCFLTRVAMNNAYSYAFKPEKKQKKAHKKGHARRVDFGVFYVSDANMELFYTLEAKKLPTEKIGHQREKEYVTGNYGAIRRFKDEEHGLDKLGNLLNRNGIIAYITDKTLEHWHTNINLWIDETNWGAREKVNKNYFREMARLSSIHIRKSKAQLHLDHFWVRLFE